MICGGGWSERGHLLRHPRRAEDEVLACESFPRAHGRQDHPTNPRERLNREVKCRTNVAGIFPNEPRRGTPSCVSPSMAKNARSALEEPPGRHRA